MKILVKATPPVDAHYMPPRSLPYAMLQDGHKEDPVDAVEGWQTVARFCAMFGDEMDSYEIHDLQNRHRYFATRYQQDGDTLFFPESKPLRDADMPESFYTIDDLSPEARESACFHFSLEHQLRDYSNEETVERIREEHQAGALHLFTKSGEII